MRILLGLIATLAVVIVSAMPAVAHPLGNFTVNHLTEVKATRDALRVRYVLDIAEIPSFAIARERNRSGRLGPAEIARWGDEEAQRDVMSLDVELDGRRLNLVPLAHRALTRPGAGGLPTLYLVAEYRASLPGGTHHLALRDDTYPGRLGWKDVIVGPEREPTRELRAYPDALLGSPRDRIASEASVDGANIVPLATTGVAPAAASVSFARSNPLGDLMARGNGNLGLVLAALALAIALGALHALEPGHGKTLLAVSLVGARGTPRQALILAGSLTVAHTAGVLALGIVVLCLARYVVPDAIYPWITLTSGAVVALLAAQALARAVASHRPHAHSHVHVHDSAHPHAHEHAHAPHEHHHGDTLDDAAHARLHAIPGSQPLSFRAAVVAAVSGGIAPCPAALVVLLVAISQHLVLYGLALIVAFSIGLASTLTALGIAVVHGASWLAKRRGFNRFVTYGPLLTATIIALVGASMIGQGFVAQGITRSSLPIAGLVFLAILGFSFAPRHSHLHLPAQAGSGEGAHAR